MFDVGLRYANPTYAGAVMQIGAGDSDIRAESRPRLFDTRRRPGDLFFAAASFALALFLLIRLPDQTRWFNRVDLLLQPRFWPSVVLGAFTLFSGLYLMQSWLARKDLDHLDTSLLPAGELAHWLRPLEFALYFVVYAASIPWLGYLPSTVLFMPLLGLRAGIRSPGRPGPAGGARCRDRARLQDRTGGAHASRRGLRPLSAGRAQLPDPELLARLRLTWNFP